MLLSASGGISTAEIQEANASVDTIGYAKSYSRSADAVICFYDAAGNVITMSTVAKLEADHEFSD